MDKENVPDLREVAVFALDIGTRSIIGIVGMQDGEIFRVLDVEVAQHTRRAMMDGQIEDIEQVARVAGSVKRALEQRLGFPLTNVHIAAAGRSLKTVKAEFSQPLEQARILDARTIAAMEDQAIRRANASLLEVLEAESDVDFYCAGYSVTRYLLDGYPLSTLVGHKGHTASVEIIATFLPSPVVDSLHAVLSKMGLTVASLTLEPIAAMNAVIPQELRILNLALADIGAGTTDIALSKEGSIVGYTMATIAGDEITEAIIRQYLVDFDTAERMKMELQDRTHTISFRNILNWEQNLSAEELLASIQPAVDTLCEEIASQILTTNGTAPAAVFLVGGGSLLPGLPAGVAARLDIEPNKVAVGSNNFMKRFVCAEQLPAERSNLDSPEFVTPVGIALTAARQRRNGFLVHLNGTDITVYKEHATVLDVLTSNGFENSQFIGRSGKSVTFERNGQKKICWGEHPTPALIQVNRVAAGIATPIGEGDEIVFIPAVQGRAAQPRVLDLAGEIRTIHVTLNGEPQRAGTRVVHNGQELLSGNPNICDRDVLQIYELRTLGDLLRDVGTFAEDLFCTRNGIPAEMDTTLEEGDKLTCQPKPTAAQQAAEDAKMLPITLNGAPISLKPKAGNAPHLFLDLFNLVDLDPTKPQGNIVLTINGRNAAYLEEIQEQDAVEIHWEKTHKIGEGG